jgi:carboxylesterase
MPKARQPQFPAGFAEAAKPISVRTNSPVGVLVVHGITSTPGSLSHISGAFAAAGFNVEAPLLPGHGTHWNNMQGITWQEWLTALQAPLRDLQARCSHVFVFGLSLGGGLALLLARETPKLAGLVLVNHLASVKKTPLVMLAPIAHHIMKSVPNIANDIKAPGITEPAYPMLNSFAGHQAILVAKEVQLALPHIHTPTLIFKSREDHVIPISSAHITLKKLGSTQKEIVWLTNSYHVATMDFDKAIIAEKSLAFVHSQAGGLQNSRQSAD